MRLVTEIEMTPESKDFASELSFFQVVLRCSLFQEKVI